MFYGAGDIFKPEAIAAGDTDCDARYEPEDTTYRKRYVDEPRQEIYNEFREKTCVATIPGKI